MLWVFTEYVVVMNVVYVVCVCVCVLVFSIEKKSAEKESCGHFYLYNVAYGWWRGR